MPVPDQLIQETPEETAARVERWKAFGEMIKSMPEQPQEVVQVILPKESAAIINASTKPGYDHLNSLNNVKFTVDKVIDHPNPKLYRITE